LKKTASIKRANPPRSSNYTKVFLKDWQRLSHSGRYDMKRLKEAMMLLMANDAPLSPEWLDHALRGDWADHRECHIGGDFLLMCGYACRTFQQLNKLIPYRCCLLAGT
jgi:mRNA interferase YafQ